jgi:DNA-binding PucR family transcriptional regulator
VVQIGPTPSLPSEAGAESSLLEDLLENLGRDVIQVVASPRGLDVRVGDPVIYDPTERSALAPASVVLAVGVHAGTSDCRAMLRAAAEAGAAAVVVKGGGDAAELSRDAAAVGVALLSVPEEMTWTQLYAFLLNATGFSAQPTGGGGIAGVPLGDLFALANAIASVVGGAVTIEDPSRRVLAYSTLDDQPIDAARRRSILGRQVPDSPGMRALYRTVLSETGVFTSDPQLLLELLKGGLPPELQELKARSAVAIRAGSQAIGSIWVVHDEQRLDEESEHALAEAARIAAPHMIQARAARDVERRMRAEMLLAVLDGRDSAEETAVRLGFSTSAPLSVLAFELVGNQSAIDELQRERLVDLVVVHCGAACRQTAAVALGRSVYALLQGSEREIERQQLVRLAEQIQAHAEARLGTALRAALGSTVDGVRDVSRARREAERVLGVLRADPQERTVAAIDDVRSEVVLLELRELSADHPSLARGKLERVLAYDAEHRSSYALTLRAYLDAFGDVAAAATRLSVHPNTFRYRMRRLVELFDLDLENPDERLVIELQLRLLTPLPGEASPPRG